MKLKFLSIIAAAVYLSAACTKTKPTTSVANDAVQTAKFSEDGAATIDSREQFNFYALDGSNAKFLKYTNGFGATPPFVRFQNTKKYKYHSLFLGSQFPQFKNLLQAEPIDDLIYRTDKNKKQLTVGIVAINDTITAKDATSPGVIGFNIAFSGKPGPEEFQEIKMTRDALAANIHVGISNFVFMFEVDNDFFTYGKDVRALGITPLLSQRVVGRMPE